MTNNRNCYGNTYQPIQPLGLNQNINNCLPVFSFTKLDETTGLGIPGAVFELRPTNGSEGAAMTVISNADGFVQFPVEPCIVYQLTEITPAAGYSASGRSYQVMLDSRGCLFIDCEPVAQFVITNTSTAVVPPPVIRPPVIRPPVVRPPVVRPPAVTPPIITPPIVTPPIVTPPAITGSFTAIKLDAFSGMRLSGFEFTLSGEQNDWYTVSTLAGEVTFSELPPGVYRLRETGVQSGYQTLFDEYEVIVASDGSVTINGVPADGYVILNLPVFPFSFFKLIAATATGIPGAVFELSSGATAIRSAISGPDGLVDFGELPPGEYALTEISPPPGFAPSPSPITVIVTAEGVVTAGGIALREFFVPNETTAIATRALSGLVRPVAFSDLGLGADFLSGFDTVAELLPVPFAATPAILSTVAVPLDATGLGQFTLPDVPPGSYMLHIRRPGYLARNMLFTLPVDEQELLLLSPPDADEFNLWAGDLNGDNRIDSADIILLSDKIGLRAGDLGYSPAFDLNADGVIDSADLTLLLANLGRTSADYPGAESANAAW